MCLHESDCPIEFEERVIENISTTGMMLDALRYSDEIDNAQKVKTTLKQENLCNSAASIGICEDYDRSQRGIAGFNFCGLKAGS